MKKMNGEQDRIANRWESLAVTGSLILILATTLYPYSFHLSVMHEKLGRVILSGLTEISFLDVLRNIILFIPRRIALESSRTNIPFFLSSSWYDIFSTLPGTLLMPKQNFRSCFWFLWLPEYNFLGVVSVLCLSLVHFGFLCVPLLS